MFCFSCQAWPDIVQKHLPELVHDRNCVATGDMHGTDEKQLHRPYANIAQPELGASWNHMLAEILIGQLQKTDTVLTGKLRQTDTAGGKVCMREDSSKTCGLSDWCLAHWTGVIRVKPSLNARLMVDVQTR